MIWSFVDSWVLFSIGSSSMYLMNERRNEHDQIAASNDTLTSSERRKKSDLSARTRSPFDMTSAMTNMITTSGGRGKDETRSMYIRDGLVDNNNI